MKGVWDLNHCTIESHQPGSPSWDWELEAEMNAHCVHTINIMWVYFQPAWSFYFSGCAGTMLCTVIHSEG